MPKRLSRRDFLKLAGSSTAVTAIGGFASPALVAAKPPAQDPITISFMGWGGVVEDEGVRAAIEVFEEEQSAVRVRWLHTPDNYNEKLLSNVAAGTPPDTAFISQSQFRTLVHDGLTMDITNLVQADPVISQPDYFIEPQEIERSTDENGRWHGIGSTWTALHFFYNHALLEEAGIEPPSFTEGGIWDWDTFVENARLLTKDAAGRHPGEDGFDVNDVVQWGIFMDISWWMMYDAMAKMNGGQLAQNGLMTLDTPEAIAAIQAFGDLIHVHQVMPEAVFLSEMGMSATQMIETGRLAMTIDGSWVLADVASVEPPFGVGPIPFMSANGLDAGQGHLHSILNGSQNPEAAWAWLSFLARPFYQTHFCKLGLWIPNQTAMLTEEGLDEWITEGIHPDGYRAFVSDYVPQYMSPTSVPAGYPRAEALFVPAVQQVLAGTALAADVMPDVIAQANEILQAEYIDG
jgi:multiple sugar transport system substrate-binding protein